jgi:hypothetical protein
MSKSDTIAAIVRLNPTVNPVFLSEFSGEELEAYRMRLEPVAAKRGLPVGAAVEAEAVDFTAIDVAPATE